MGQSFFTLIILNKRFEVDTELGISANVGSKSKLTSDARSLSALSESVHTELAGYYSLRLCT